VIHTTLETVRLESALAPASEGRYLNEVAIAEQRADEPAHHLDMPRDILVVDDDRDIRETLGEILLHEGYHVELAENGAKAIELIRRGPAPALVLLDLMMPVMSGWEFLEMAETDPGLAEIPVLVVSAMPAPLAPAEARGGVKACLHKPLRLDQLLDLVHQYADTAD
jgi:two-component system response regulator CpxR